MVWRPKAPCIVAPTAHARQAKRSYKIARNEPFRECRPSYRCVGMALCAVARGLLSCRPSTTTGALVRVAYFFDNRTQWVVLFATASRILRAVVSRHAERLLFCREGTAIHHSHEATARRAHAVG